MNLDNPALTLTLAIAAGIAAQSLARHLRVPGIVLLLLIGALLGPDVLDVIRPDTLGAGLEIIVGLSVAVILFEGGLNLDVRRLRHEALVIRRLVTVGAVVTAIGGTLAARLTMDWPWPVSILFGTLVIVTGPTVVTPLLRRVRVKRSVSTILEAEGVLIDPIGAIVAVVALELVLAETTEGAALQLLGLPSRLVAGALAGLVGGVAIAWLLRHERFVPEGLENVFTLSLVLVLFEVSDTIQPESGILAATMAGLVVGNATTRVPRELREFKEQLTVLLIGLLFVLLAADVRLAEVLSLGWAGLATVALLVTVVRPLNVLASTAGARLDARERGFMAWLAPRGIVAAAVASLFAERLAEAGYAEGAELRALVFLVIAVTVVVQGLASGSVAGLLGLRRPTNQGYAILGANPLGRVLAHALRAAGEDVAVIDANATEARAAEAEGLRVVYGNANDESVMVRADVEGRRGFLAVTSSEGANLLLARRAKDDFRVPTIYTALHRRKVAITTERAAEAGARVLFGRPIDLEEWIYALRQGQVELQRWRFEGEEAELGARLAGESRRDATPRILPLVVARGGGAAPVDETTRVRRGDVVAFALPADGLATPNALGLGPWAVVSTPGMQAEGGASA